MILCHIFSYVHSCIHCLCCTGHAFMPTVRHQCNMLHSPWRRHLALPHPLLPCAAHACAAGSGKRDYVRWAPEEEAAFFEALRGVAGQKPEKCIKEIVARVGTKDYAQVNARVLNRTAAALEQCCAGLALG